MTLEEFFKEHTKLALGFSGGVDSSLLLHSAVKAGADIAPYFVKTAFQPAFELEDARRASDFSKTDLRIIKLDVLVKPEIIKNEQERCYHCKKAIFGAIADVAHRDGYSVLIDGTNASDDASDRPGMRAIAELGVLSPLKICGLTKDDVRRLSYEAGLFTHDKPSYSCLATRIASGEEITPEKLSIVEKAETFLMSLGFSDFRVRISDDGARRINGAKRAKNAKIELTEEDMGNLAEKRDDIVRHFERIGLDGISLDLKPRKP